MAFSIKNPEADQLLRQLTGLTGESLTTAVTESLRQRLTRERLRARDRDVDPLDLALSKLWSRPVLNDLTEQELMGWDEYGLPT